MSSVKAPDGRMPLLRIHAELPAFMQSGVSIIAGSGGRDNVPTVARCRGCRVSADDGRVTVLLSGLQSKRFLEAVRATGSIAVVYSQPSTHRTIQLKGSDASVTALEDGDVEISERYVRSLAAELGPLGYREEWVRAVLWCDEADLLAITFTPSAAFTQTPGPRAGVPLADGNAC